MSDYYCPYCGADLEEQIGFIPSTAYWTCIECGQFLTNPADSDDDAQFDGVGWFCDGCGAYLNKQSGFSDWCNTWICTECGYTNNISEDEIYASEEDYQCQKVIEKYDYMFNEIEYDTEEDDTEEEYDTEEYDTGEEYNTEEDDDTEDDDTKEDEYIKKQQERECILREQDIKDIEREQIKRDKRKATFKRIWSAITNKKLINVNVTSSECIGQNYLKVITLFEKNGFTKIHTKIVEDLEYIEVYKENIVSDVTVNGSNYFEAFTQAKYDTEVVITFHKLKKILPPLSFKEVKRQHGEMVIKAFEDAGFVNVKSDIIRDLIFGWIKKDGKIDSVTVGNENKYKVDKLYRIDTQIVVTYHTFKKKS